MTKIKKIRGLSCEKYNKFITNKVIISSCAGSAQHQVVSANRAGDANLDCKA